MRRFLFLAVCGVLLVGWPLLVRARRGPAMAPAVEHRCPVGGDAYDAWICERGTPDAAGMDASGDLAAKLLGYAPAGVIPVRWVTYKRARLF